MTKLSFSLPLTVCVYIAASSKTTSEVSALSAPSSRRGFLNKASVATTGATMGWLLTQHHPGGCACGQCAGGALQHSAGCNCASCTGAHVAGCQCGACVASSHDAGCSCGACMPGHDTGCGCFACAGFQFGPMPANAYEKREVGGANRSAATAAFNIQSEKTYARLEASGYPLDTRAEEQARLADALSSFSYPDSKPGSSSSSKDKKDNKSKK